MKLEKNNDYFATLRKSAVLPYLLLFLVMFVLHLQFTLGTGDDIMNKDLIFTHRLDRKLVELYQTWSARQLVDCVMYTVSGMPYLLWQVLNPLMITLSAFWMARFLGRETEQNTAFFAAMLMLSYQWANLNSAGWVCTTLTQVWPLAAGLTALQPHVSLKQGRTPPKWQMIGSIPLLLYAVNMEQFLVVALLLLCVYFGYQLVYKENIHWLLPAHITTCLVALVYAVTCPGVALRAQNEMAAWFKDFGMRSVWQNIELGLSNGFSHLMYHQHYLYFIFCLMLVVCVFGKYQNWLYRAIVLFPFAITTVLGLFGDWVCALVPQMTFFKHALTPTGMLTVANAAIPKRYLSFLLLCFAFSACFIGIYLALGHTKQAFAGMALFFAGFASHGMMGFSSSIWVSGNRTAFFCSMSLVGVCLLLYRAHAKNNRIWRGVQIIIGICALAQCISLIGA